MEGNKEKIFKIVIDYETARQNLQEVDNNLKGIYSITKTISKEQAELNKQYRQGAIDEKEYTDQTLKNASALTSLRKEKATLLQQRTQEQAKIKLSVKEMAAEANSVNELRARLNSLKRVWADMDRNSPEFAKTTEDINQLTKKIKEAEAAISVFNRNVGNYPENKGFFGAVQVFAGNLMTKAVDGIGRLISKGKEFVVEGIAMARTAEGVTTAFNKLNDPELLKNLRANTKGTVNDLELMQAAVRAKNFNIPLENLGSLLKFAQQRAQETGESVDYLVESIVNGIGRKSKLILDNLGISAVRLQKEVKETGDFTQATIKIVNEELEKQGDLAITSGDRAQQASVKWQNAQLAIGEALRDGADAWTEISGEIAVGVEKVAKALGAFLGYANRVRAEWGNVEAEQKTVIDGLVETYLSAGDDINTAQTKALREYKKNTDARLDALYDEKTAARKEYDDLVKLYNRWNNAWKDDRVTLDMLDSAWAKFEALEREGALIGKALNNLVGSEGFTLEDGFTGNFSGNYEYEVPKVDTSTLSDKELKELEKRAKKREEALLAITEQGHKKELATLDKNYKEYKEALAGNEEDILKLEEWYAAEKKRIDDKYEAQALKKLEEQQTFRVSLMEDGLEKDLAAHQINYQKRLNEAEKNGTDIQKVEEWNQREIAKIRKKHLTSDDKLAQEIKKITKEYENQKKVIESSDISREKKQKEILDNELKYIQARQKVLQTYLLELQAQQQTLGYTEDRQVLIENTLAQLSVLATEAETLATGTSFLARMFSITDEQAEEIVNQALSLAEQISQNIASAKQDAIRRDLEAEKQRIDSDYKINKKLIDDKRRYGLTSEAQYQKDLEKLEQEKLDKTKKAEEEAFEREKRVKISQAWMELAIGTIRIWAQGIPMTLKAIQTAALILQTGIQVAAINKQKYAQGALLDLGNKMYQVKGQTHSQGGHQIYLDGKSLGEVEHDEVLAIVNRHDSKALANLSSINSRHGRKFALGGIITPGIPSPAPIPGRYAAVADMISAQNTNSDRQLQAIYEITDAINRRIDRIGVYVLENDVTGTQDDVRRVNVVSGF